MAGSSSDFEEFNKQTDDAWDGGDDDLLLEAFNVRISRRDVQSAASQVFFYCFVNKAVDDSRCCSGVSNVVMQHGKSL